MSKTNSYFHIVINTYCRKMTITEERKKELYAYILGILNNKKCKLIRINGIGNHVHILLNLNPTIALSDIVKTIKQSSSLWMKASDHFPNFDSWGKEYFAYSVSPEGVEAVRNYIIGQEQHHTTVKFENELRELCIRAGIDPKDIYLD